MALDVNNPYLRTKVMTASPEELRLMLIDGCLRFLRQGLEAMESKDYEGQFESLCSAKNIILELMTSMKHEAAPELCARLDALYTYMFKQVTEGGFERDGEKVREVISLMDYERETWVMLMDKLSRERSETPDTMRAHDAAQDAGPFEPTDSESRLPLSIEG